MEESVDLHEEAGKENEQTLANLSPAEKATNKDEVEMDALVPLLSLCFPFAFLFGHMINILLTRSLVQTSLRLVCTADLGQDCPIQTSRSVNKS